MSSQGAAPLKTPGSSNFSGNRTPPPPSPASNAAHQDSPERRAALKAARLEQLLDEIDQHHLALVPVKRTAQHQPPPAPRIHPYLLAFLVVWVTACIVGIVYIRSIRSEQNSSQAQRELQASMSKMSLALNSSSQRINQLETELNTLRRREPPPPPPQPEPKPTPPAVTSVKRLPEPVRKPALPVQILSLTPTPPPPQPLAAAPPMAPVIPAPPPQPNFLASFGATPSLQPTKSSVPHHTAEGALDYWLVPRGEAARTDRCIPIGSNAQGIVIHDIDDGKEYTVTPLGDWHDASMPNPRPPMPPQ